MQNFPKKPRTLRSNNCGKIRDLAHKALVSLEAENFREVEAPKKGLLKLFC